MEDMIRFRDVALVASLFGAMPVVAGTSLAKTEGMDTPALSCTAPSSTSVVPSTPTTEGAQGLLETLIADFRRGQPRMGAVPHLPISPPYRMRAEKAVEGGDEAPRGRNGGNVSPLHVAHLVLVAPTERVTLPQVAPKPIAAVTGGEPNTDLLPSAPVANGRATEPQSVACGTTDHTSAPTTNVPAPATSTPAVDTDRAALESSMPQLTAM
jgi:hypothetical protein